MSPIYSSKRDPRFKHNTKLWISVTSTGIPVETVFHKRLSISSNRTSTLQTYHFHCLHPCHRSVDGPQLDGTLLCWNYKV